MKIVLFTEMVKMSAIPWTRGLANCYFIYLFIDASNTYIPLQSCGVILSAISRLTSENLNVVSINVPIIVSTRLYYEN